MTKNDSADGIDQYYMNAIRKERLITHLVSVAVSGILSGIFLLFLAGFSRANFIFGFLIGIQAYAWISLFSFFIERKMQRWNLLFSVIISAVSHIILLVFSVFISFEIMNSFSISLSMFFRITEESSGLIIRGLVFGFALSLLFQIYEIFDAVLGKSIFPGILLGRYDHPFEEERVFMFLDMESSTSLAEKLGHKEFLSLLNDFFSDLAEPVTSSKGRIYKYVGDEAIITWNKRKARKNSAPLGCYFNIKDRFIKKQSHYEKRYGFVPGFRAALHGGRVVTGKMGLVKKEIAHIGDVMNTSARMLDICRELKKDFIVSGDALDMINPSSLYNISPIGGIALRGKEKPVSLFYAEMA